MKTKGQAAMEFLMTYGWAILAAIIVIGVLAIYFRPSQLQGSSAIVTAPLYANAWNIDATADAINLELQNNAGEPITIQGIAISGTGSSIGTDCTAGAQSEMAAGVLSSIAVSSGCTFDAGDQYTGDITIKYTRGSGSTNLTSSGSITDTAS